jgi:hypothetical protein
MYERERESEGGRGGGWGRRGGDQKEGRKMFYADCRKMSRFCGNSVLEEEDKNTELWTKKKNCEIFQSRASGTP